MNLPTRGLRVFFGVLVFFVAVSLAPSAFAQGIFGNNLDVQKTSIPSFLNSFYGFALVIGGVLAMGAIVFGGVMYITEGAIPQKKTEGKTIILGALWGLALLLGAYVILRTVNPEIVTLDVVDLDQAHFENSCATSTIVTYDGGVRTVKTLKPCTQDPPQWPRDDKGQCVCYANREWVENFEYIKKNETEKNDVAYNEGPNGSPPSQSGCCTTIDSRITVKNNNKTDRGVAELLVRLANTPNLPAWRVTEACPPTSKHQSRCHQNGDCRCADIAVDITKVSKVTCDDVNKLLQAAKNVGFRVLNEYSGCGGVNTKYTSGGHLHVGL